MADHTVIRHQLDLVLHLVDTTTGSSFPSSKSPGSNQSVLGL